MTWLLFLASNSHSIERKNMLSLLKLVVHEILESSMERGRTVESGSTVIQVGLLFAIFFSGILTSLFL